MNKNRALVPKEPELVREIKRIRKDLFETEKRLFSKLDDLVSIKTAVKDFYVKVYLPRLGDYLIELEDARSLALGLPSRPAAHKNAAKRSEDPEKELSAEVKKEIKNIYRKLARLYHPDRLHDKEEHGFLTERMASINEAFHKKDLESLKRYLKRADAEIGLNLSSPERIKRLELELCVVGSMDRLYAAKVEDLKKDEIYKLMRKDPAGRDETFKRLEERFRSDIDLYKKVLTRFSDRSKGAAPGQ